MPSPLQGFIAQSQRIVSNFKPYLRWVIFGGTIFFLVSTLRQHWSEVTQLRIDGTGWSILAAATGITLIAHIWSGWVWSWILQELNQPAASVWGILVYLKTNIAKYLPGNVWHLYGRITASTQAGIPVEAAALSVVLEPLLMATAALFITIVSLESDYRLVQLLGLGLILAAIHPRLLNPLLQKLGRLKAKSIFSKNPKNPKNPKNSANPANSASPEAAPASPEPVDPIDRPLPPATCLKRYPVRPLLGEMIFVLLRGVGFLFSVSVLTSVSLEQIPLLISAFSFAWLLGLVVPGAPGGIGVFEATAIALLDSQFPPAIVFGSVAIYRLISTIAEAVGAGLAVMVERSQQCSKHR
ncbi:lysylphosphatidylglycerol synthase domain-containing protein [Egbenema bharatensis]|uniref:lysylphosphatidylglycerol synthase domain-containing protein n=1 Tax=Egbenema bharatensis TaxID=3463334 RepID=UPI003A84CEEA